MKTPELVSGTLRWQTQRAPDRWRAKTPIFIGFSWRLGNMESFASGTMPATCFLFIARMYLKMHREGSKQNPRVKMPIYALCARRTPEFFPLLSRCIQSKTSAPFRVNPETFFKFPLMLCQP